MYRKTALSTTLVVFFALTITTTSFAQDQPSKPTRDPHALQLLSQVLQTASSAPAAKPFRASGEITYQWAGKEVTGRATLRGQGDSQYRLDADLPEGTLSWAVNNGAGAVKRMDGSSDSICQLDAMQLGSLTSPAAKVAARVADPDVNIRYVKLLASEGSRFHHIQLQKNYDQEVDRDGLLSRASRLDVFIDAATLMIISIEDQSHANQSVNDEARHTLYFSDYRTVNGVSVPFSISERVGGQKTWTIKLNEASFDGSVSDSDFNL